MESCALALLVFVGLSGLLLLAALVWAFIQWNREDPMQLSPEWKPEGDDA